MHVYTDVNIERRLHDCFPYIYSVTTSTRTHLWFTCIDISGTIRMNHLSTGVCTESHKLSTSIHERQARK